MLSASTVSSNAFNTVMGDVFVYCLMRLFCVKPPRRARRHDSTAAAAFLAQRVDKVWSCCLLSGVCLCCRDEKSSAVVICTEDGHCVLPLAPYATRWTTDSRLIPCFLARPFVKGNRPCCGARKLPVTTRSRP